MHSCKSLLFEPPFEDSPGDLLEKVLRGKNISPQKISQDFDLPPFFLKDLISKLHNITLGTSSFSSEEKAFLEKLCDSLGLGYIAFEAMIDQGYDTPSIDDILPALSFKVFSTSNDIMEVNSYLIWEEDRAIAIDTGFSAIELLKIVKKQQLHLKDLLLTHTHSDHCQALPEILQKTAATVWVPEAEAGNLDQFSPLLPNFQERVKVVKEGNSWSLPSHHLKALSTPGHSPGGTSYLLTAQKEEEDLEAEGIIFVGDALFARSIGKIDSENYEAGIKAIEEKILALPIKTLIAPGHGPMTSVEYEGVFNPLFSTAFSKNL